MFFQIVWFKDTHSKCFANIWNEIAMYFLLPSKVGLAADCITERLSPNILVGYEPYVEKLHPKQQSMYLKLITISIAVYKAESSAG